MIKPILRTLLLVFAIATAVLWYYEATVHTWVAGIATAVVTAAEVWLEWLKSHVDKYRELRANQEENSRRQERRKKLESLITEGNSLLQQITDELSSIKPTYHYVRPPDKQVEIERSIDQWRKELPSRLNDICPSCGARLLGLSKPNSQQEFIKPGLTDLRAGTLRQAIEILVALLKECDK